MRKKNFILLFILMGFIFPMGVHATSLNVNVRCSDVTINKTTKCTVTGSASGGEIISVRGNFSVKGTSGTANFVSMSNGSGWQGQVVNGNSFSLYGDAHSGSFTIATFELKGTKAGSVTFNVSNIVAGDNDLNEFNVSGRSATFKVNAVTTKTTTTKKTTTTTAKRTTTKYTNNTQGTNPTTTPTTETTTVPPAPLTLTSLKVDDFAVTNEGGIYYATVNAETESVMIEATADAGITIIGTGKRNLAEGKNAVELVLRDNTNRTTTVQLIITRPDGTGVYDTLLTSLKVVDYKIDFKPDIKEYTITVPSSVKELYIMAESYSDDVTITGSGLKVLSKGANTAYITVTYGDLAATEYKIQIKRSYSSTIFMVLIGLLTVGFGGFIFYSKHNTKKKVAEAMALKNREQAEENREAKLASPQIQVGGESVVSTGRNIVTPTKVVDVKPAVVPTAFNPMPQAEPVNMMENAAPQVKIVKKQVVPSGTPVRTVKRVVTRNNPNDTVVTNLK